jgi:hypothetical protein
MRDYADMEPDSKIFKLATEAKRLATLMTSGRYLHDIHTMNHHRMPTNRIFES